MTPAWVRGVETGQVTAPMSQPLALTALGGSIGTPPDGIEAEIVRVGSMAELEQLSPASVKGKIAFVDRPMTRTSDGSGYGEAALMRAVGASTAGRLGAVGFLIRSVATDRNRLPHTGGMQYRKDAPRIPAAALSVPDAELLTRLVRRGGPVRVRFTLGCHPADDAESANVIGEVVGREKPEEIVLLGAHLDSWDLGTGAIDDAAGIAIMMETARRLAGLPRGPRRTIRVVLYANEELGTSGARSYAAAHQDELARHVMAGESDLGSGRVWRLSSHVDPARLPVVADLAKLLGVDQGGNDAEGGSDLRPMSSGRVPVLSLSQDASEYFDYHHTANDTLDKIDPKDLDQNVAAWTAVVYAVAEMPGDLGRAPEGAGRGE